MAIVLSGAAAIARHLYGDDSPYHQRRVRHLVTTGAIPHKKFGRRIESRPEWLESIYAEPDPPRVARPADEAATNGAARQCAEPGCSELVPPHRHGAGRPRKYCEQHRRKSWGRSQE